MTTYLIIWPEYRTLTEEQVRTMYADAVANDQVDDVDAPGPLEMAMELHSAGIITLGMDKT